MKLIMEGIHLIYGEHEKHSFLGRQLRGLLLFSVSIVAWVVAVALSVFGRPLRQWMILGIRHFPSGSRLLDVRPSITGDAPGNARPGVDLLACADAAQPLGVPFCPEQLRRRFCGGRSIFYLVPTSAKCIMGPVYGGLAAVFGLMIWMEFSVMIVFLGAAWNAENLVKVSNCEQTSGTLNVILQELCWMNSFPVFPGGSV